MLCKTPVSLVKQFTKSLHLIIFPKRSTSIMFRLSSSKYKSYAKDKIESTTVGKYARLFALEQQRKEAEKKTAPTIDDLSDGW